ncbi:hypothetical protein Tco_0490746 [Tanacetum coccineum]
MKNDPQLREADYDLWNILKINFEASSMSPESCRQNIFHKRDHDVHPDDDVDENMGKDFQENSNDDVDESTSEEYLRDLDIEFHERALLAGSKLFIKRNKFSNEEEVPSNAEQMVKVKVLMALAEDEQLVVGKNHVRNENYRLSHVCVTLHFPSLHDSEPGRAFWGADYEGISEGGIPRVIVLGYDGLPLQPVAPPSPDFMLGPENLQTPPVPQEEDEREPLFIQAHDPNYVPEPIYPEYIPLEDDHEFRLGKSITTIDSPTVESPGYITEWNPRIQTGYGRMLSQRGWSGLTYLWDEDEDEEDEEEREAEEHLARPTYYPSY